MATEERADANVDVASVQSACERCGDFGTLRWVSSRQLCAGCVERLPDVVRTQPTLGSLLAGVVWVLTQSAKRALPIALIYATVEVLVPWALEVENLALDSLFASALNPVAQLLLLSVFHDTLHGAPTRLRDAGWGLDEYVSLFFTNVYTSLVTMLAMLALVVPGLVYMTRYVLTPAVVRFERKGGGTALNRSTAYVEGVGWPVFGALMTVYVLPLALFVIASFAYVWEFPGTESSTLTPAVLLPVEILTSASILLGVTALVSVVYANRRFHTATGGPAPAAPYPPSSQRATPAP